MLSRTISIFFMLSIIGCNDSSKIENTYSNSQQIPVSNSTATPSSLPVGTELVFNPKIIVTGVATCSYDNSSFISSKLPVTTGSVECNMTFSQSGDELNVILINSTLFGLNNLKLSLAGFVDKGNDGYIDQFSVAAVHGSVSVIETGQFIGSYKPRNTSISDNQVTDVSGAPTVAEWNSYIVKNMIFLEDNGSSFALIQFLNDNGGSAQFSKDGDSETVPYTYEKLTSANTGSLKFSSWSNTKDGITVEVTFDTFYHGTWKATWTDDDHGGTESDEGEFNMYTDNSLKF